MSEVAYFGGGCFWCLQPAMDAVPGVVQTSVGFMGGSSEDAVYEKVYTGTTDHVEIVSVEFDAELTAFRDLLWVFWKNIQPTQAGGQFADKGSHYRSVVFASNAEQFKEAQASLDALKSANIFDKPVVTTVEQAQSFYPASEDHQQYHLKNPEKFQKELGDSGREEFLACGGNPIRREDLGW